MFVFLLFFSLLVSLLAFSDSRSQPKRLHVSNIPFRFRDPDLRAMFGVSIYIFAIMIPDAFVGAPCFLFSFNEKKSTYTKKLSLIYGVCMRSHLQKFVAYDFVKILVCKIRMFFFCFN